jgi:hypothetical protein
MGVKVAALDLLGVTPLLCEPDRTLRESDPEVQAIASVAQANRWQIKAIFGFTLAENEAPIRIVGRFVRLVGAKLSYMKREGPRGNRERVYQVVFPDDDGREEIVSVWRERDAARQEEAESVSKELIDPIEQEPVDEGPGRSPRWQPAVGSFVRWLSGGAEKLVVLAVEASGQVQVRSLLSGLVTQTRADRVAPLA